MSKSKFFIYNDNTVIQLEKNMISMISLIPLLQEPTKDYKEDEEIVHERYNKKKIRLTKMFQSFIPDTLLKKGTYGPVYKVLSYFEKLTSFQEFLLIENSFEKDRLNKIVHKDEFDFSKLKKDKKVQEIIKIPFYKKIDFLVVKTFFPKKKLSDMNIFGKKDTVSKFFNSLNKETLESFSDIFQLMYVNHQQNFEVIQEEFSDSDIKVTQNNVLDWFVKLNLQENISGINDFDFQENNFMNPSKPLFGAQLKILLDNKFQYRVVLNPSYLVIKGGPNNINKVITIKSSETVIYRTEKVEYKDVSGNTKEVEEFIIYLRDLRNNIDSKIFSVKSPKEVIEDSDDYEVKHYTLSKVPGIFYSEVGRIISEEIKKINPDSFVLITEVIKYSQDYLKDRLSTENGIYNTIDKLPAMNGFFYDKDTLHDKKRAVLSQINHLDETPFFKARFGFSVRKTFFSRNDSSNIIQLMEGKELGSVIQTDFNMVNLNLPFTHSPFLKVSEMSYELSPQDMVELIDLKYGAPDFSKRSFFRKNDLLAMKNNGHIFVQSDDTIFAIDIFKGPDMFNGIIIAPSGSGKSFTTVNLLDGFLSSNSENIGWIIDRGGSYVNYTELAGGDNINIKRSSITNCINPFVYNLDVAALVYLEFQADEFNKSKQAVFEHNQRVKLEKEHGRDDLEFKKMPGIKEFLGDVDYEIIHNTINLLKTKNDFILETDPDKDYGTGADFDILYFNEDMGYFKPHFVRNDNQELLDVFQKIIFAMLKLDKKTNKSGYEKVKSSVIEIVSKLMARSFKTHYVNDKKSFMDVSTHTEAFLNEFFSKTLYTTIQDISLNLKITLIEQIGPNFTPEIIDDYLAELDVYINRKKSGNLFNGKPNINFDKRLLNIDFGEIQDAEDLAPVLLSALLLNFFKMMTSAKFKGRRKVLVIDESHAILNAEDMTALASVAYLFRTTRKHGASVFLLSQAIPDFIKNPDEVEAKKLPHFTALAENSGWKFVLGRGHNKEQLKKLELSNTLTGMFSQADSKKKDFRFLIQTQATKNFVSMVISSIDYWVATTHDQEKLLINLTSKIYQSKEKAILKLADVFGMAFVGDYQSVDNMLSVAGVNVKEYTDKPQLISILNDKFKDLYLEEKPDLSKEALKGLIGMLAICSIMELTNKNFIIG